MIYIAIAALLLIIMVIKYGHLALISIFAMLALYSVGSAAESLSQFAYGSLQVGIVSIYAHFAHEMAVANYRSAMEHYRYLELVNSRMSVFDVVIAKALGAKVVHEPEPITYFAGWGVAWFAVSLFTVLAMNSHW